MKGLKKLVVLAGLTLTAPLYAQEVTFTTLNWPPFIGETEEKQGVLAEIVKQTMEASNTDFSIEFTDWTSALESVKKGDKDALIAAYFSEERTKNYYYSLPIYSVYTGLIKRDNMNIDQIQEFEELNDYRIGKLADSVVGESFDKHPFPHMQEYATEQEAVQALYDGELDFYAGNLDVAKDLAKKIGHDGSDLTIVKPPIHEQDIFVIFSKATDNGLQQRDAFNQSLINLQASGEYDALLSSFK